MSKQTFIVGVDTDKKSFEEWIAEHDAKVRAEAYKRGVFDLMCRLCDYCLTRPNECSECPFWNTELGVCEVVAMAEQITEEENEYKAKTSAFSVDAATL